MKKIEMIEFINDNLDWFEKMQIGLGHDSWWYTNRGSEDCINVKIYPTVYTDDLVDKLSDKEKKIIDLINFDVEEWMYEYVWSYYGIIDDEREMLEEDLKARFKVKSCEYGGRSGGWLAVVFDWKYIPDDLEDGEYTYKEVKEYYNILQNAIKENAEVIKFVQKRKEGLKKMLEDETTYLDELKYQLKTNFEFEQENARELLAFN